MVDDFIGWFGTFFVLLAYVLVSTGKIKATDKTYQLLNVVGAGALMVNTFVEQAIPALALNTAWLFIALFSLIKSQKVSGKKKRK